MWLTPIGGRSITTPSGGGELTLRAGAANRSQPLRQVEGEPEPRLAARHFAEALTLRGVGA